MSEPVNVGVVGIGRWANVLADAVEACERINIVTCYTRSSEKRADFSAKRHCAQASSFEALLSDDRVDAVLLTTPHSAHKDQVIAAAAAGKHVFVEKPICNTVAEAQQAIDACEKAGVKLAVGHSRRRAAGVRKVKQLLDEGAIGKVVSAEANLSHWMGQIIDENMWRWSREESPGGPLTSLGIHHIDNFLYLLGPVVRVSSFFQRLATPAPFEDVTSSIYEFESGALGYLGCNFANPKVYSLNVYGTEGNLFCKDEGNALFWQKKGETLHDVPPPEAVSLQPVDIILDEIDAFAKSVQNGEELEVGGKEGLATVAVIEAMVKAAETGQVVRL